MWKGKVTESMSTKRGYPDRGGPERKTIEKKAGRQKETKSLKKGPVKSIFGHSAKYRETRSRLLRALGISGIAGLPLGSRWWGSAQEYGCLKCAKHHS
jgi:hypothetical protein